MQEGILQIGSSILKEGGVLNNLVKELSSTDRKGQALYVCKLNFITESGELKIDINEEMTEDTASKYLFIGSAPGPASAQWYVTSTSIIYHLTETIPNLTNIDLGEQLGEKISFIKENYYLDFGEEWKSPKNRYVLDFSKLSIGTDPQQMYSQLEEAGLEGKKLGDALKKQYPKVFEQYVKLTKKLNPKQIGLYTILIDGKMICNEKEYREAIIRETEPVTKKTRNNTYDKYCYSCATKENVTSDIKTAIKFYTTNQFIFGSGVQKANYEKNMLLCVDCINKIKVAEKYMMNNLSVRLATFNVYIVPHFIIGETLNKEELDECVYDITNSFNTVTNYEALREFNEKITSISLENENQSYYLLNFIFYKQAQQATKVQRLVKDVHPSIFTHIREALNYASQMMQRIYQDNRAHSITLTTLYYLMPIRLDKGGQPTEYKKILDMYDRILSKRTVRPISIIENVINVCKIYFFNQEGYNIREGTIERTMQDANKLLKFLAHLGCIKEGENMDITVLEVDDMTKRYIEEMKYNEQQAGLFLLGHLIGEIGFKQWKDRRKTKQDKFEDVKKPILNKLNFGGIDKGKLIRLCNEVFGKLHQEKLLQYNEKVFSNCKYLIDKNMSNWKLNKKENLFYILSGYGYTSYKINASKNKEGGQENE